jgi:hypothetical protein
MKEKNGLGSGLGADFVRRMSALLFTLLFMSCREEQLPLEPQAPLLWEVTAGDTWIYEVNASYPEGTEPRVLPGENQRKRDGRILLKFERHKIARGPQEVKEGKGAWEVIEVLRGGEIEEYEYLEITPERVSFLGSKKEGSEPGRVMSVSMPLDLVRREMEGGESWDYALGSGSGNVRSFRVMGREEVVVPAGTFEAAKIMVAGHSRKMDVKEVYWFHSEAGFVKIEKTFYTDDLVLKKEVMELIKRIPSDWTSG